MILATHALVGAVIGKNITNPWEIIFVSIVVHYALDSFRHGEYFDSRFATIRDTWWKVFLDLSFGCLTILFCLIYSHPTTLVARNIILGAFFSMLPDLVTVIYWKFHFKFLEPIMKLHAFVHRYTRYPKFSPERVWTIRNARNDILISLTTIALLLIK